MLVRTCARAATACLTVLVLAVASCGTNDDYLGPDNSREDMSLQQQFDELMQRPTSDEAVGRYEEMQTRIRDRLGTELGLAEWHQKPGEPDVSPGCSDFSEVDAWDAEQHRIKSWILPRGIPDDQWPRVEQVVREVAGDYGFGGEGMGQGRPGFHDMHISDQFGAELSFGAAVHTSMRVATGCHLNVDAKNRSTPRNTPSTTARY